MNSGVAAQAATRVFVAPARGRGVSKFPSCRRRAVVVSSPHVSVSEIRNCSTQAAHSRQ